jgi:hypothetical protein
MFYNPFEALLHISEIHQQQKKINQFLCSIAVHIKKMLNQREREIEYGYFSVTERTKKLDAIGANHLGKMIRGYEQWVLKPLL